MAEPDVIDRRALGRATLARQMLLERADVPVVGAVERLVGLQAQAVYSPYYGLWSRVAGFEPDDLASLLLDRRVVRIAVMRGTVHLVSADDCLVLRPLTQPLYDRDLRTSPQYAADLAGLDLAAVAEAARALVDDAPRTAAELRTLLAERWPRHAPAALAHAARGLLPLVQVPPRAVWGRSGQARLTTAEAWLGRPLAVDPSPGDMVLRYLAAFGPASVADAQVWSGLTRLKDVFEGLRPGLRAFRSEAGVELFDLPDAPRPGPDVPAPVRFLPDFDNLLRSHADRTRVISDQDRKGIATKNGVTPHAVLVDGEFAGTWRVERDGAAARLAVSPVRALAAADRAAVAEEGARLLAFAAADVDAEKHEVDVTHAGVG